MANGKWLKNRSRDGKLICSNCKDKRTMLFRDPTGVLPEPVCYMCAWRSARRQHIATHPANLTKEQIDAGGMRSPATGVLE